jgi:hypothetical protein
VNGGVTAAGREREPKARAATGKEHAVPRAPGACLAAVALSAAALAEDPFPESRDPLAWPFARESIWNTPIGSDAVYVRAQIAPARDWGMTVDEDIIILEPNAPATDIYYNSAGWSGGDRCPAEGGVLIAGAPIPYDFVVPGGPGTPNSCLAVLMPDGTTVKQGQPFARCTPGGAATIKYLYPEDDIVTGNGIRGAHGGSGMSSLGGTLHLGELVPGAPAIRHVLKVNLYAKENLFYDSATEGYRWPAWRADSYAAGTYGGKVRACRMGALLALTPSTDVNAMGLETEPALALARALQDYGAYVVDDTAWSVYGIAVERSPNGRVTEEFERAWGFSMTPRTSDVPWARDMDRIFGALHVVDNNGPDSVGGGGTPRAPLAPPFAAVGRSEVDAGARDRREGAASDEAVRDLVREYRGR